MHDPIYRRASEPDGSLIAGVVNAFTILVLFCVVIAMLWIMINNAFAGALEVPEACAAVSRSECAVAVVEVRQ